MNLLLPLGVEQVLEKFPIELTEALPSCTLSPICAFLPLLSLITLPPSIYHVKRTRCVLGLEIQAKPDSFPGSRSFHRRGYKTLLPFIYQLFFWWESAMSQGSVLSVLPGQPVTGRGPILLKQFWGALISTCRYSLRPRVTTKRSMSRYKEEIIIYFLG